MSKVVIPKHSADIDEMSAVLRIHYEAGGWVSRSEFKKKLMALIGTGQYPSSYPKKAQVPAYFGFLESRVSSGGRILERKISKSGKQMYEAIVNDDLFTRQKLIMEALETHIFGRNNAGCTSSNSDIEAPAILVKCILDAGYCTCAEYAHLVWSLNDKCKKYYESLAEIVKARSVGGISINSEADEYKDWKPALAMQRWGFLVRSDDAAQKLLLHPNVIQKFSERLENIKIYNIDKHPKMEGEELEDISLPEDNSGISFKSFKINDSNKEKISEGHFLQACDEFENQKIFVDDWVLLVDRDITKLVTYYSYRIKGLDKRGTNYDIKLERKHVINKSKEQELITALKAKDEGLKKTQIKEILFSLTNYENYEFHLNLCGKENKDVLPAYLILKALLTLNHMSNREQDYLVYSVINSKETYTDVIEKISLSRKGHNLDYEEKMQGYSLLPPIQQFKDKSVFDVNLKDGKQSICINPLLKESYLNILQRLSFYSVDIERDLIKYNVQDNFPKSIKALLTNENEELKKVRGHIKIRPGQSIIEKPVRGDFVVFVDEQMKKIQEMHVFQISECKFIETGFDIHFERRHVINPDRVNEIINIIKEK